jgi:hypothetical protein
MSFRAPLAAAIAVLQLAAVTKTGADALAKE